jgi:hypothetical protein
MTHPGSSSGKTLCNYIETASRSYSFTYWTGVRVRPTAVRDTKGKEELPVPSKRLLSADRNLAHCNETRRQRSSGLWHRIFWQTGYNASKNPPANTYRAVQCGLFNDVTATAQIQRSSERPTAVHGRLGRLQCLENKTINVTLKRA